jgi:hypothetical protein
MHTVSKLSEIPTVAELTVIINCGTKWVTTLALMAAALRVKTPILLIDCESRDGSRQHFERLARKQGLNFYWLEWPLRHHGVALDQLFREVQAETLMLLDSDLEILSEDVVVAMRQSLVAAKEAYASGFLHGPMWLGRDHEMHEFAGYYAERMWIPCVMFRVQDVKAALNCGSSFVARRTFHDFAGHPRLSRLFALRHKLPVLRKHLVWRPRRDPSTTMLHPASEFAPSFIEFDTGADVHMWQKQHGKKFVALPSPLWGLVRHYHGVTRARLANPLIHLILKIRKDRDVIFTRHQAVAAEIRHRLAEVYDLPSI